MCHKHAEREPHSTSYGAVEQWMGTVPLAAFLHMDSELSEIKVLVRVLTDLWQTPWGLVPLAKTLFFQCFPESEPSMVFTGHTHPSTAGVALVLLC